VCMGKGEGRQDMIYETMSVLQRTRYQRDLGGCVHCVRSVGTSNTHHLMAYAMSSHLMSYHIN
jgi:hypothetical protein